MKQFLIPIIFIFAVSCTDNEYLRVDKALAQSDFYTKKMLDSLERLKMDPSWESSLELSKAYSHFQLDSCLRYSLALREKYDGDPLKTVIGESRICLAHQKLGHRTEAICVFENIDTSQVDMNGIAGCSYFTAGYQAYGGSSSLKYSSTTPYARLLGERLEQFGADNIEALFVKHKKYFNEDRLDEDITLLLSYIEKNDITINEKDRAIHYLSQAYNEKGDEKNQIHYLVESVLLDVELSVKNYNSLYELGLHCYEKGDLERAGRYISKSLSDAQFCNQPSFIRRSIRLNNMSNQALHRSAEITKFTLIGIILLLVAFTVILTVIIKKERQALKSLKDAKEEISELSAIKDCFISGYLEKCAEYIIKVDKDRSFLKQTAKNDGIEQLMKVLRSQAYSDNEFTNFLNDFDRNFTSLFPHFVDKVNHQMQPGYEFEIAKKGCLPTELRILALIRLGIEERPRIAKILHTSVGTIYTYHSVIQKHSLLPSDSFDEFVRSI